MTTIKSLPGSLRLQNGKIIFVIFDLSLLHLFHLIFVGYRWKMKKSIASGRSGSTFQHPYLAFTAVCKSEPFFYN